MIAEYLYWLTIAEYILSLITVITLLIGSKPIYPLFTLLIAFILSLIHRLGIEKVQRRRLHLGLKQIHRELLAKIREIEAKFSGQHFVISGEKETNPEESSSNQEYLLTIEKSLSNVIQYLNSASLPERVEYLEKICAQLSQEVKNSPTNFRENSSESSGKEQLFTSTKVSLNLPSRQSWQCLHTFTEHSESVTCLQISPDSCFLTSGSWDKSLKLWSLAQGELIDTVIAHEQGILTLSFTAEQINQSWHYYLATGSFDRTIKLWKIAQDREQKTYLEYDKTFTNHTGSVHGIAIASKAKILISGSYDQTVKQWNLEAGTMLCSSYHASGGIYAIAYNPARELIASAGGDGTVSLWQLVTGNLLGLLAGNISSVKSLAISQDGEVLAAGCSDGTIKLWSLETSLLASGKEVLFSDAIPAHSGEVTSLAFARDGQTLFSGGSDGKVKIWHLPSQQMLTVLTISNLQDGHTNRVSSLALSSDGELLATGSVDGIIKTWLRD